MKKYTLSGESKVGNQIIGYCGCNMLFNSIEDCLKEFPVKSAAQRFESPFQYITETDSITGESIKMTIEEARRISKLKML